MLPCKLPAIDTLLTIAVCLSIDIERDRIITSNNPCNDLVCCINTGLIREVGKDVIADFSIPGISPAFCLKSGGGVLVQRTETWTGQLII